MYRIVHNPQSDRYRVERRGLFGWAFVHDPDSDDYLGFDSAELACDWIRARTTRRKDRYRRWQVVTDCCT